MSKDLLEELRLAAEARMKKEDEELLAKGEDITSPLVSREFRLSRIMMSEFLRRIHPNQNYEEFDKNRDK